MKTEISIVLPIYNEKTEFLQRCLQSIAQQSFVNWECLCIIESTDFGNEELVSQFTSNDARFRLIKPDKKIGLPASLNLGVECSKSSYIARMDSDDVMLKNRLERQYKFLKDNPGTSIVGSAYQKINHKNEVIGIRTYPANGLRLWLYFCFRCGLAHPTVLFKKDDFKAVGGYDEKLQFCEDLDLWLRYKRAKFIIHNIQEELLQYRSSSRGIYHWKYMLVVRLKNFYKSITSNHGK